MMSLNNSTNNGQNTTNYFDMNSLAANAANELY